MTKLEELLAKSKELREKAIYDRYYIDAGEKADAWIGHALKADEFKIQIIKTLVSGLSEILREVGTSTRAWHLSNDALSKANDIAAEALK